MSTIQTETTPSTEKKLVKTSASYSLTLRLKLENAPGTLGKVTSLIGELGGDIGAIDIVGFEGPCTVRDITINVRDEAHGQKVMDALNELDGIQVLHVSDRTFLMHLGGKIRMANKVPLKTRDDLSMAYTPGLLGFVWQFMTSRRMSTNLRLSAIP